MPNKILTLECGELYKVVRSFAVWNEYKHLQSSKVLTGVRPSDIIQKNEIVIVLAKICDPFPNDNIVIKLLYKNQIVYVSLGNPKDLINMYFPIKKYSNKDKK